MDSIIGRGRQPPETPLIAAVLNLSLLLPCQPFINVVALLNLFFCCGVKLFYCSRVNPSVIVAVLIPQLLLPCC